MQVSPGSAARLRLALGMCAIIAAAATNLRAQDLSPRAYIITPVHANAITFTWAYYNGSLNFGNAVPITNATGQYNIPILTLYHSLSFFGRSANINIAQPYAFGNFQGNVGNGQRSIYRSGLVDTTLRFSVNLIGGPAMPAREYARWRQKTILGVSLKVLAPSGQYSGTKLVNWGANRWAFKPELGYSKHLKRAVIDAYGGVWLYTSNPSYYDPPVSKPQSEEPIGSLEAHWSYNIKPRAWVSVDGNFWWGGVTSLDGIRNLATRQTSSRIGATGSFPISKTQSIKVSYSDGTYIRFGGNYQNVSVAWQYSWIGRPR